jgi:hypothetical protein
MLIFFELKAKLIIILRVLTEVVNFSFNFRERFWNVLYGFSI